MSEVGKPRRPKCFMVDAKPYSYTVYFCVGTREQGAAWLKRKGVADYDLTDAVAYTIEADIPDRARICVWMDTEQKTATLVHELCHAAVMVLTGSGVPVNASSQEALAYLVEHLFIEAQWRMMRPVGSK